MPPTIEQERELARQAGVTHPDNYPFLLESAAPNPDGILLVHGFSSSPRELRSLGELLQKQGFTVMGVRLPGHGTSPADLAARNNSEWLAVAERGYQILSSHCRHISAIGLSTGCLILLQLAAQQSVHKLLLLSPFLRLQHPLAPLAGFLSHFIKYQHRQINPEDQDFYYARRPLKGVAQINKLARSVQALLPNITTPTLVLASKGDKTINIDSAQKLYDLLGSEQKEIHWYGEDSPHVLTADDNPGQQDVFRRALDFLAN